MSIRFNDGDEEVDPDFNHLPESESKQGCTWLGFCLGGCLIPILLPLLIIAILKDAGGPGFWMIVIPPVAFVFALIGGAIGAFIDARSDDK